MFVGCCIENCCVHLPKSNRVEPHLQSRRRNSFPRMSHLPCGADADVALICDIAGRVSMCLPDNVQMLVLLQGTTPATSAAGVLSCAGGRSRRNKTRTPAPKRAVPSRTFLSSLHQQQSVIHNLADFSRRMNNEQEGEKCQKEEEKEKMSAEHQMAR